MQQGDVCTVHCTVDGLYLPVKVLYSSQGGAPVALLQCIAAGFLQYPVLRIQTGGARGSRGQQNRINTPAEGLSPGNRKGEINPRKAVGLGLTTTFLQLLRTANRLCV